MPTRNQSLHDLGYSLLGPLLGTFFKELYTTYPTTTPVCLAREGWAFRYILNRARSDGFFTEFRDPIYLKVSRSLMHRAVMADEKFLPQLLSAPYIGTFRGVLQGKFAANHDELQCIPDEILNMRLTLPTDVEILLEMMASYADIMLSNSIKTASSLIEYLRSVGLFGQSLDYTFLDIGYSGTIQKLLTHFIKKDTKGLYLVTCAPELNYIGSYQAKISGVLLQDVQWGDGHLLLERSLLMECLLTAPHGQLRDIRQRQDHSFEFLYGTKTEAQRFFQDLFAVILGAADCVIDMLKNDVSYSLTELVSIFSAFSSPYSAIPMDTRHLFSLDDEFCGNGILNPTKLYKL